MTKAIIFDCFGVLSVSTYTLFYKKYFKDQPEKIEQAKHLDRASNQGSLTLEDYYAGVAELAGISVDEARGFITRYQADEELLEFIRTDLKPHYKIGFLSNVADNLMDRLFTDEQQALFDDVVLSYEVRVAKPDPAIFELAAKRLEIEPEDCIFVDDVESFCRGARNVGMSAIVYANFEQFRVELEQLL